MPGKAYTLRTDDGVIGRSGKVIVVYGLNIVSAATPSKIILRNGTTTGGTAVITHTGTASVGSTVDFGGTGVIFPSGCFADTDANISSVAVWYEEII